MGIKIFHVDAFTDKPFSGNPAAVCLLKSMPGAAWMQALAAEMNLSETAFVVPGKNGFRLRWFTPATEVELCGHATLASAHALWECGAVKKAEIKFHTLSGRLTAARAGDWIELDFPARPQKSAAAPAGLARALGKEPLAVSRSGPYYIAEFRDEKAVRALAPDFEALKRIPMLDVAVTARGSGRPYDFVSRVFAPAEGVNEDPVTGSAHCGLAPYWAARLGKAEFLARQVSRRGGTLRLLLRGDRVKLMGRAVTVSSGEIAL
ncbi:MAG: PhzF family phenazine biosynthesis protein [Elusimicrobiales bacterium]|nr:PhzF family phenazine biosynthesis protein [Elusimicrobiales bacterium]